ncbi:MAG: hypothetical protein M1840_004773 [Geoglossum simile]|nr:MAG: hypothetical protein M1840_004773 [Geoglossum simile]
MSYQYYMTDAIQQYYYDQIKKTDSIENDVDNFWLNLLPDYFQKKLNFGIEQEARPLPEITKQRADWTIRYIKNGSLKKVVLMEDKRKGTETQPTEWREALSQLIRYLKLLEHHESECIGYPGTNGKPYELAKDEAEIHGILLDLVQKTSLG